MSHYFHINTVKIHKYSFTGVVTLFFQPDTHIIFANEQHLDGVTHRVPHGVTSPRMSSKCHEKTLFENRVQRTNRKKQPISVCFSMWFHPDMSFTSARLITDVYLLCHSCFSLCFPFPPSGVSSPCTVSLGIISLHGRRLELAKDNLLHALYTFPVLLPHGEHLGEV